jgi:hypothetical protein
MERFSSLALELKQHCWDSFVTIDGYTGKYAVGVSRSASVIEFVRLHGESDQRITFHIGDTEP